MARIFCSAKSHRIEDRCQPTQPNWKNAYGEPLMISVGIPAKANAKSRMIPNGIPG
jgi:hypothetical protein